MNYSIEKSDGTLTIKMSDDVNIQSIGELKNVFTDLLNKGDNIIIDNTDVSSIDLTYYQLLVSFLKLSESQNKRVLIKNNNCFTNLYNNIGIRDKFTLESLNGGQNE